MEKKFNTWNEKKQELHNIEKLVNFREKDIFFVSLGENIGFEQNGKDENFLRPVLVYKKFSKNLFLGIPLTKTPRDGKFYYTFKFKEDVTSTALLSQIRLLDSKRLKYRSGMINKNDFKKLSDKLFELLKVTP